MQYSDPPHPNPTRVPICRLIQRTIRTSLQGVTCLTIAHRLHTIMDADKVLVMDNGRAGEFGTPRELCDRPGGLLSSLIDETGTSSAERLRKCVWAFHHSLLRAGLPLGSCLCALPPSLRFRQAELR